MSESKKTVFVVGLGPGGGQFLTVQAQSALQQKLDLRFAALTEDQMRRAAAFLKRFPGATPVILFDAGKRMQKSVPDSLYVNVTDALLQAAETEFGKDNVKLK